MRGGRFLSPDRKLVAVGSGNVVTISIAPDGQVVKRLAGATEEITAIAWSPDGGTLASADFSGKIRNWDLASGKLVAVFESSGVTRFLAWSPNGEMLASGLAEGTVILFDPATGREIRNLELGNSHPGLESLVWNPNSVLLTAVYEDGTRVWDVVTGAVISQSLVIRR